MSAALWVALAVGWLVGAVVLAFDVAGLAVLFGFAAGMCFAFGVATRMDAGRWWQ